MSRYALSWARGAGVILAVSGAACSSSEPLERQYGPASRLYDSQRCAECHPKHFEEWSASMHAYAAEDPVFLAMNRRGQEETNGALGPLCVNCHAPLAVRTGATTDGLNLDSVPPEQKGVTCYFCHNTVGVDDTHNNPLRLSDDVTLRARIRSPVENDFHRSSYSALLDGERTESAAMCGSCHDIVLPSPPAPAAVPLERTYTEWQRSVFAPAQAPAESAISTCASCHVPSVASDAPIAPGGPHRSRHSHHMAGVDGPLTPFPSTTDPEQDAALAAAQAEDRERLLDPTLRFEICLQVVSEGSSAIYVTLDNSGAGHSFPSGAAQDRRAFTELIAYQGDQVLYQTGVVTDGQVVSVDDDPDLWLLRDETFDVNGEETHMFWTVADHTDRTVSAQLTADLSKGDYYKSHAQRRFPLALENLVPGVPDRITVRMRLMPVGLEVIDDLVGSGHLDASVRSAIQTLELLPYRHKFVGASLEGLHSVSMEWSATSRASGLFVARDDFTKRPPWSCVGMPRPSR